MGCLSPTRWPVIIGCQQPQATRKDRRETKILEKGHASGMAFRLKSHAATERYMVVQIASPDMTRVSDAGGIRTERFKRKLLHSEVRRRQD